MPVNDFACRSSGKCKTKKYKKLLVKIPDFQFRICTTAKYLNKIHVIACIQTGSKFDFEDSRNK